MKFALFLAPKRDQLLLRRRGEFSAVAHISLSETSDAKLGGYVMDEVNRVPNGWHIADTCPSGVNVLMPDECRPISLPHVRTYTAAKFSAGFWMFAGILTLAAVAVSVGLHVVRLI